MKNKNQLQLVNFEQAKRLKEAGFDWDVNRCFNITSHNCVSVIYGNYNGAHYPTNNVLEHLSAPTVALALKWFRDVKGKTGVYVYPNRNGTKDYYTKSTDWLKKDAIKFVDYEAAKSALLDELLNLINPNINQ
jgi:hypothetical protein